MGRQSILDYAQDGRDQSKWIPIKVVSAKGDASADVQFVRNGWYAVSVKVNNGKESDLTDFWVLHTNDDGSEKISMKNGITTNKVIPKMKISISKDGKQFIVSEPNAPAHSVSFAEYSINDDGTQGQGDVDYTMNSNTANLAKISGAKFYVFDCLVNGVREEAYVTLDNSLTKITTIYEPASSSNS